MQITVTMKKESKDIISCVLSMQDTTSYYQPFMCDGKKITCVFENPTWLEELLQRPVAGIAGSRLCVLFKILRHMDCKLSSDFDSQLFRHRVCIVNGVREVYSTSANISDCKYRELVKANEGKLKEAVEDACLVVCFGNRAEIAMREIGYRGKYVKVYHLSDKGLGKIILLDDILSAYNFPASFRGLARLIVVAEYLATWYDAVISVDKELISFSEFTKPFRKCAQHSYLNMDIRDRIMKHTINFETILNCAECSDSCCRYCGAIECRAATVYHR